MDRLPDVMLLILLGGAIVLFINVAVAIWMSRHG
jgi:hypothetical protein